MKNISDMRQVFITGKFESSPAMENHPEFTDLTLFRYEKKKKRKKLTTLSKKKKQSVYKPSGNRG